MTTKELSQTNQKAPVSMFDQSRDLWNDYDRFVDSFFSPFSLSLRPSSFFDLPRLSRSQEVFGVVPRVDVAETDNAVEVMAELPGVDEKDIKVELRNGSLYLRGDKKEEKKQENKNSYYSERRYGSFERVVALPCEVERDKVDATFKDGVLKISLPKTAAAKEEVKQIKIKH